MKVGEQYFWYRGDNQTTYRVTVYNTYKEYADIIVPNVGHYATSYDNLYPIIDDDEVLFTKKDYEKLRNLNSATRIIFEHYNNMVKIVNKGFVYQELYDPTHNQIVACIDQLAKEIGQQQLEALQTKLDEVKKSLEAIQNEVNKIKS